MTGWVKRNKKRCKSQITSESSGTSEILSLDSDKSDVSGASELISALLNIYRLQSIFFPISFLMTRARKEILFACVLLVRLFKDEGFGFLSLTSV